MMAKDWSCRYCGSYHPPEKYSCVCCGAPRLDPIEYVEAHEPKPKADDRLAKIVFDDGAEIAIARCVIAAPPEAIVVEAFNRRFRVAGRNMPPTIEGVVSVHDSRYFMGWMDELRELYCSMSLSSFKRGAVIRFPNESAASARLIGVFPESCEIDMASETAMVRLMMDSYEVKTPKS